jgi:hypothetical protein
MVEAHSLIAVSGALVASVALIVYKATVVVQAVVDVIREGSVSARARPIPSSIVGRQVESS